MTATLTALLLLGPAFPDVEPKPLEPTYMPGGGVLSADRKTAFVQGEKGTLLALDAATGKVRWSVARRLRPLLADDKRLFAWERMPKRADQLRLVVLDAASSKALKEIGPATLPDWANVNAGHGNAFGVVARLDGDKLLVVWEAKSWYEGGVPPSRERTERSAYHGTGEFKFNLKDGKVMEAGRKVARGTRPAVKIVSRVPADRWVKRGTGVSASGGKIKAGGLTLSAEKQDGELVARNAKGMVVWRRGLLGVEELSPLP
jgi:outer membrane protein assembly factor BamB